MTAMVYKYTQTLLQHRRTPSPPPLRTLNWNVQMWPNGEAQRERDSWAGRTVEADAVECESAAPYLCGRARGFKEFMSGGVLGWFAKPMRTDADALLSCFEGEVFASLTYACRTGPTTTGGRVDKQHDNGRRGRRTIVM